MENNPIFALLFVLLLGLTFLAAQYAIHTFLWRKNLLMIEFILGLFGWPLVVLGSLAIIVILPWLLFLWFIGLIVFSFSQRWHIKQQGFLWMMAMATEKSIPLASAVEAYAKEVGGVYGWRVFQLARLLDRGVPLLDALTRIPNLISRRFYPLLRTACESNDPARGFRHAAIVNDAQQGIWDNIGGKMLYVVSVLSFGIGVTSFIMLKIVPSFEKIFKDFGMSLPPATKALIGFAHGMFYLWPLVVVVLGGCFLLLIYCVYRNAGWTLFDLPGMKRLMRRQHTAAILETLAVAVEGNKTLLNAIRTLAEFYPNRAVQKKLRLTLNDMTSGIDWHESLRLRGLISSADAALLMSAQRTGNLSWAMRESAEANLRRLSYTLQASAQAIFPFVVLTCGAFVMFFVVSLFMPLIYLIQRLSS